MLAELVIAAEAARVDTDTKRRAFLGAIAVRADGCIVRSRNGSSTSVCPNLHAEARVARKAGYNAVFYVARLRKNGEYAMAKPCKRCMLVLKNKGARLVCYTIDNNTWGMVRP